MRRTNAARTNAATLEATLTPDALTILAAMRGDEVGEGFGSSDWDIEEAVTARPSIPEHLEGLARRFAVRVSLGFASESFEGV
jgi:hypothetical protein